MDIFSIVIISIFSILIIISSIYLYSYYSHPDEEIGIVTKTLVFISMCLCFSNTLLILIDLSNIKDGGIGLDMKTMWYVFYISTLIFIVIILPILSTYNELDEDIPFSKKISQTFLRTIIFQIIFLVLFSINYIYLNKANVPITQNRCSIIGISNSNSENISFDHCQLPENGHLTINTSIPIFIIGFFTFISWFFFIIFASVGIVSLPYDLIKFYFSFPRKMSKEEIRIRKREIIDSSIKVKELAENLKELENNEYHLRTCKYLFIFNFI